MGAYYTAWGFIVGVRTLTTGHTGFSSGLLVELLRKRSTIPATAARTERTVDEKTALNKLEMVTSFSLIFEILIARDLSTRLMKTSLVLQDCKTLEWENGPAAHAALWPAAHAALWHPRDGVAVLARRAVRGHLRHQAHRG